MRYVFYDKQTGRIVHTMRVYSLTKDERLEPTEDDVRAVLQRFPDPSQLDLTRTELPPVSTRQAARAVDLRTGKVVSTALAEDDWSAKLRRLAGKGE